MWCKGDMSVVWKMRIICLIDKRDNQNKSENYRRMKFLIFMYKVHQLWYWTDWHNIEKKLVITKMDSERIGEQSMTYTYRDK